jgi:phage terminase large subunit
VAAAEGAVYEESWDRALHLIDSRVIPAEWPRYWVVDFGYTNPFVWQAWAQDRDGRLYRYREIYHTRTLVEDHAKQILKLTEGEPKPRAIICDHDAEDRATLEKHLGQQTVGAYKAVSAGIQAVASRLRKAGDGKPRLLFLRDSLVSVDRKLAGAHKPTCTEEEFESYVWDQSSGRRKGEEPIKEDDHGMDAVRYLVAHVDDIARVKPQFFPIISILKDGVEESSDSSLQRPSRWRIS